MEYDILLPLNPWLMWLILILILFLFLILFLMWLIILFEKMYTIKIVNSNNANVTQQSIVVGYK